MSQQPTHTTHTRRHVQSAYLAAGALDTLPGEALYEVTRALRFLAGDHDKHAATMRECQQAGGVPDFMTADAAGRIAEAHEVQAVDLYDLADLLDAGEDARRIADDEGMDALAEHIRENHPA
jgi:hypothetical protein